MQGGGCGELRCIRLDLGGGVKRNGVNVKTLH